MIAVVQEAWNEDLDYKYVFGLNLDAWGIS